MHAFNPKIRGSVLRPDRLAINGPAGHPRPEGTPAPRAQAGNAAGCRKLELDGRLLSRCQQVPAGPLRGARHLTRSELSACLAEKRIPATGQRFAYIFDAR